MCENTRQEQALCHRGSGPHRVVSQSLGRWYTQPGVTSDYCCLPICHLKNKLWEKRVFLEQEKSKHRCVQSEMSRKHCLDWGIGLSLSALFFLYVPCAVTFNKKDISTQGFPQCNGGSMWAFGLLTASAPLQPTHTPVKCSASSETLVNKTFALKKCFTSFWKKMKL